MVAGALIILMLGAELAGWNAVDRVGMVSSICAAGFPNISRPAGVDARELGCAVLGPRETLRGTYVSDFEISSFVPGDRANGSAWLSGTDGLERRGGDLLRRRMADPIAGGCGLRIADIEVEGWMTISAGGFGHLGLAEREFFVDRVVAVNPPSRWALDTFTHQPVTSSVQARMCAEREKASS